VFTTRFEAWVRRHAEALTSALGRLPLTPNQVTVVGVLLTFFAGGLIAFGHLRWAGVVLVFALNSQASIFKMVENAYKVMLVAAFVPLCAGLYWSRATTQGALCAFVAGLMTWMGLELFGPSDSVWPPQLVGFLVAAMGMVVGSLLPQKIGTREA